MGEKGAKSYQDGRSSRGSVCGNVAEFCLDGVSALRSVFKKG